MYENIQTFIDKLITQSTPDKPLWNVENVMHGRQPHWNYVDGCMMTALIELGYITGDAKYFDFVNNFVDYYVGEDGSLLGYDKSKYNLDDVNEGRVLFDLYRITGKMKYLRAIKLLKSQLNEQPRTDTGNFWHKKIYPNQIWLDGLYMAQVFSTRYQNEIGSKNYSDVLKQITNVHDLMFDRDKGLYYHGLDCSKQAFWADKNGLSQNFWLRAIGWYCVALVDVVDYCDNVIVRSKIADILVEAMDGVSRYVDASSNMLYQVVDQGGREGNYLETSGSSMIAYAMLKGARLGVLDDSYATLGKKIFDGICNKYLSFDDDGGINLGGICLVAGLGPDDNRRRDGTYEYYISEPVVSNDAKGVAPFVMCFTEIKRLDNNL